MFEEIAECANLEVHCIRLALRNAMMRRWFCEPETGHVGHTASFALFITEPDSVHYISHIIRDSLPGVAYVADAIER